MVPVRYIEFSKFIVYDMSCDLYCHAILLLCANVTEIEQLVAELWQKRILKWRSSAILNFRGPIMGSLKSPCRTYYRSSLEIAQGCLVFA